MDGSETEETNSKSKINQEEERFQTIHQNSILQGIKILKPKWILTKRKVRDYFDLPQTLIS